jgi:flagellar export protein FliJ
MKDRLKASLKQLKRLVHIRDTYVSAAESGVKQAEEHVRSLEAADSAASGNIQRTRAEIAYRQTTTGRDVHNDARYLQAQENQRELIRQSLEMATGKLEQRRKEWTEAMREKKIVAKLQERRLHQFEREDDVAQQKAQDDAFAARYVRTRFEN